MHEGTFTSSLLPHLSYNIHHPIYLLGLVGDPQYHIPGRLGECALQVDTRAC